MVTEERRGPGKRPLLAGAGALLILVCVLPPVAGLAHTYVVAASAQFAVFAIAGPALIVLGAPWRLLGLADWLGRLAAQRSRHTSYLYGGVYLVTFIAVCLVWRLPPVVNALARHPALLAAELVTLCLAGIGLWLELAASPPLRPRLAPAQRAATAAFALWSTWIAAYALGFAGGPVFQAYDGAGSALSAAADRQITVGLVWAVAAVCFIPMVFVSLFAWLRESDDPASGLHQIAHSASRQPAVKGWERGK